MKNFRKICLSLEEQYSSTYIFLSEKAKKVKVLVIQSCPIFFDSMDYSLPGSSVHGILQSRVLAWIAILFFRVSS